MPTSSCPFSRSRGGDCGAASPAQHALDKKALEEAGLAAEWIGTAMQCGYCGGVYSWSADGTKVKRGYFRGDLIAPDAWEPL